MEILNKQQFLEAVKEDSSLILQCDMRDGIIFFSHCSEPFTMDEYKDLCNQHIHDFEAYSALIDYLVQSSTEDTINAVARRIAYDNFMNHKELNERHFTTDKQGVTSIPLKKWKMSYVSEPDIVPHKTGIPKEWLDKAINIEIVHSDDTLDSDNPKTLHLGTISKDEFLDTIRRYYLDGIIPYEDLKYIKCLTEEDIEYITRQPQGTLSVPIPPVLINMYGIEEAYRHHQKLLYRRK